ncbi:cell division protein FtsL [Lutibacter sp. B2]|nr:cell division protein FtsL [Lutibacter sp. B2]
MIVAQREYKYEHQEMDQQQKKPMNRNNKKRNVKQKSIPKLQIIFIVLIIAGLCIGILFGYVRLTELKYNVNKYNKEIQLIESHLGNLKVELEKVKRSDLIEDRAKNELGMQYPEKKQMVFLEINMDEMNTNSTEGENKQKVDDQENYFIEKVKKVFNFVD